MSHIACHTAGNKVGSISRNMPPTHFVCSLQRPRASSPLSKDSRLTDSFEKVKIVTTYLIWPAMYTPTYQLLWRFYCIFWLLLSWMQNISVFKCIRQNARRCDGSWSDSSQVNGPAWAQKFAPSPQHTPGIPMSPKANLVPLSVSPNLAARFDTGGRSPTTGASATSAQRRRTDRLSTSM